MSEPTSTHRATEIAARMAVADALQALYRAHDAVREDPARDEERMQLEREIHALLDRGVA